MIILLLHCLRELIVYAYFQHWAVASSVSLFRNLGGSVVLSRTFWISVSCIFLSTKLRNTSNRNCHQQNFHLWVTGPKNTSPSGFWMADMLLHALILFLRVRSPDICCRIVVICLRSGSVLKSFLKVNLKQRCVFWKLLPSERALPTFVFRNNICTAWSCHGNNLSSSSPISSLSCDHHPIQFTVQIACPRSVPRRHMI